MNSVGDEPSGITGIKSGVRSQIGFWDSFYQKTAWNYWFEIRSTADWPLLTAFDRGWQDCGWYDHFWNVLKDQSNLIREFISAWYHTKLKKIPVEWCLTFLLVVFFSLLIGQFVISSISIGSFFVSSLPVSQFQKFLSPQKNIKISKYQKFSKSRIFWKLKFGRIYYF